MDPLVPALVEYRTLQLTEMEERACRGRLGTSWYDMNVAIMAAMASLQTVATISEARAMYPISRWNEYFNTESDALAWKGKECSVVILTPYKAMLTLLEGALDFLVATCGARGRSSVRCFTIDAVQGATFEAVVIAVPDVAAGWGDFVADPRRVTTMCSRQYYMLVMPNVRQDPPSNCRRLCLREVEGLLA